MLEIPRKQDLQAGSADEATFDTLFRSNYGNLCTFAYGYVHSTELAEEIVQDVFASLWQRRDTWQVDGSVRAYLFGAVRNRALRGVNRGILENRGAAILAAEAALEIDDPPATDTLLDAFETENAVRDAVATLPERGRLAVTLRYQQQMSYAEIAQTMGISVKGVEHLLGRAWNKLRGELSWLRAVE